MTIDRTLAIIERIEARRRARRGFLRTGAGAAVVAGGLSLLAACGGDDDDDVPTPTPTPGAALDADILNFALQLEYLEAQFYSYAAFGNGLSAGLLTGTGTQGPVAAAGTATGPRAVTFTDPVIAQYAREIAYDEIAHVTFLRTALGSAAAAMPAINISGDAGGPFTAAARRAGVVPATGGFDPYANENNFLLGAYIFEDVGVTAYAGGAALLTSKTYLEAAAGILAAEAYHAGLIRTVLYRRGLDTADFITAAQAVSDARDTLDGEGERDEGIGTAALGNIVPADANALAFARTPQQVLNIVYLDSGAVSSGGFFPSGLNGTFRTSGAN